MTELLQLHVPLLAVQISLPVQAFVPDAKQRLASKSSTPLNGYFSDPRKIKCSKVWGSPSSSCASVAENVL